MGYKGKNGGHLMKQIGIKLPDQHKRLDVKFQQAVVMAAGIKKMSCIAQKNPIGIPAYPDNRKNKKTYGKKTEKNNLRFDFFHYSARSDNQKQYSYKQDYKGNIPGIFNFHFIGSFLWLYSCF